MLHQTVQLSLRCDVIILLIILILVFASADTVWDPGLVITEGVALASFSSSSRSLCC
jgi:hypothetical protein